MDPEADERPVAGGETQVAVSAELGAALATPETSGAISRVGLTRIRALAVTAAVDDSANAHIATLDTWTVSVPLCSPSCA